MTATVWGLAILASDILIVGLKTFALLIVVLIGLPLVLGPALLLSPFLLLWYLGTFPFSGAYRYSILRKYVRSKLPPLAAGVAVTLCTAMVIIVISVMGGFLNMMRESAKNLSSDVMIRGDLNGFAHYGEMIDGLVTLPEVQAATPIVRTLGLVNIEGKIKTPEVMGIYPAGVDAVTGYSDTLHWTKQDIVNTLPKEADVPPEAQAQYKLLRERAEKIDLKEFGAKLKAPVEWGKEPGMVPGISVSPYNRRDAKGQYEFSNSSVNRKASVTVMQLSKAGVPIQSKSRSYIVVNEFKSGLYDIDAGRVYVPFELLQKDLRMDEDRKVDRETGEKTNEIIPARAHEVMVRGKAGVPLNKVKAAIENFITGFRASHPDLDFVDVQTWEERHAMFLGAVEKEKFLLTILFAIISVVAVAMIGVIFYMIVLEKTRDIGVMRALGASRMGVAAIFLGYGLAIGVVGATVGFGLASLVVLNINEIQDFLANYMGSTLWYAACVFVGAIFGAIFGIIAGRKSKRLGLWALLSAVVLGAAGAGLAYGALQYYVPSALALDRFNLQLWLDTTFNFEIWSAQVYYFDKIPARMNPREVAVILGIAVCASVVGSLIPAFLSSRLDPVEALRYE